MFAATFLPGARSFRAPLLGGMLWALFVWLLVADDIPSPEEATGWAAQAYGLAGAAGPILTVLVVALLLFVAGAVAQAALQPTAGLVGKLPNELRSRLVWQRNARQRRSRLLQEQRQAEQNVDEAKKSKEIAARYLAAIQSTEHDYGLKDERLKSIAEAEKALKLAEQGVNSAESRWAMLKQRTKQIRTKSLGVGRSSSTMMTPIADFLEAPRQAKWKR
jgi:hypothetical protein